MPFKIKINTKKAMTEPIEMAHFSEWMIDWFEDNRTKIFGVIIALLVLGGILLGWFFLQKKSDLAALQLEYEASISFKDALLYKGDENAVREAYRQGISLYTHLTQQYPNSKTAPIAFFELGNGYFKLEEYDQALKAYQNFLKRFGSDHRLSPLVHQKIAYTYMKRGQVSEAEDHFEKIAANPQANNRDQSIFELGSLYEDQGKTDMAISKYQKITKNFPASPISSEAQARIKLLSPEPAPVIEEKSSTNNLETIPSPIQPMEPKE